MRSKLWAITALTPSSAVPFAAQSRELPVPYSWPAMTMSGTPLSQAINADTVGLVLGKTEFGRLWILRFVLAMALGALLLSIGRSANEQRRLRIAVGAVLVAAAYLASLAWAGHAAAGQGSGRYVQIVSDVVHLLAAGGWLGALRRSSCGGCCAGWLRIGGLGGGRGLRRWSGCRWPTAARHSLRGW